MDMQQDIMPMGDDPNAMGGDPNASMGMDPNMGQDPNAMGMGEEPNAMGGDPNASMGEEPSEDMGTPDGEDDELTNLLDGMSIEDKAAVTKYAKSIADDGTQGGEPQQESRKRFRNVVDETINSVIDDYKGTKRDEKKIPSKYRDKKNNPFVSPF